MKKRILAGAVSLLLLAAVLVGCGKAKEPEVKDPETVVEDTTVPVAEDTEPTTEPEETVPDGCVAVDTVYGKLLYQDQWIEFMKTEQTNQGDNLIVLFYTDINNVRYELFELTIGSGDGATGGQLTDKDGTVRDVFVRMMELAETDTLSDSEQNRLYAMQEEINFIVENLK